MAGEELSTYLAGGMNVASQFECSGDRLRQRAELRSAPGLGGRATSLAVMVIRRL